MIGRRHDDVISALIGCGGEMEDILRKKRGRGGRREGGKEGGRVGR